MIEFLFFDNQYVSAETMNGVICRVLTGGVAETPVFETDTPYNIRALNGIFYAHIGKGIVPETDSSLQVTVQNGQAVIQKGTCFFADGSHATVTEAERVDLLPDAESYVLLRSDAVQNKVYAEALAEKPAAGENVVLLAKVTANGEVLDLRRYAKGKIPSMYASDAGLAGILTFTLEGPPDKTSNAAQTVTLHFETDRAANYMTVMANGNETANTFFMQSFAVLDFVQNKGWSAFIDSSDTEEEYAYGDRCPYRYNHKTAFCFFGKKDGTAYTCTVTKTAGGYDFVFSGLSAKYCSMFPMQFTVFMY